MKKLFILSVLTAASVLLSGCRLANLKRVRVEPQPVSVSVQRIGYSDNISQRSYIGTVVSDKDATLCSCHTGTLNSFPVRQGQRVYKGQLLATVDSPALKSTYDAAMATLNQAQDGYDRVEKLYKSGSIPKVKMIEIESKLAQAKAAVATASSALSDCKICAPFDGVINKIHVNKGEHVVIGQPVVSVIDAEGLEISFPVPENEISNMPVGAAAIVEFPSMGNRSEKARVKSKSLTSNPLSHTYTCTLSLSQTPQGLMAGMVCKVYMDSDNVRGIVVPADVIKIDNEGKYVWIVEDSVACKKRVTVDGYSGKGVLVNDGLKVGDALIVEGAGKVSGGMKVSVKWQD